MANRSTITVSAPAKQQFDRAKAAFNTENSTETLEFLVDIASSEGYFDREDNPSFAPMDELEGFEEDVNALNERMDLYREALLDLRDRVEVLESR